MTRSQLSRYADSIICDEFPEWFRLKYDPPDTWKPPNKSDIEEWILRNEENPTSGDYLTCTIPRLRQGYKLTN